jgi:hypothetical protein
LDSGAGKEPEPLLLEVPVEREYTLDSVITHRREARKINQT